MSDQQSQQPEHNLPTRIAIDSMHITASTTYSLEDMITESASLSAEFISTQRGDILKRLDRTHTMEFYAAASKHAGGYIRITKEYAGLPVISRQQGRPVYLYEFVEVLDGLVDYEDIQAELPGITYSQIYGAIRFLRRIAQFNIAGVDIDDLEQRVMAQDAQLLEALRSALQNNEEMRVLNPS